MRWPIVKITDQLIFSADSDGIWLRSETDDLDVRQLRPHTLKTRLSRLLPTLVPQLLELVSTCVS